MQRRLLARANVTGCRRDSPILPECPSLFGLANASKPVPVGAAPGKLKIQPSRIHPPSKRKSVTDPITYCITDNRFEVIHDIHRCVHENRPNDERYLITLDLGPPVFAELPNE
jgi:hypothetical protein